MQFSFPFIFLLFSSPFVAKLADGSGGKRQRKTQIYPQEMAVDGEDGDGIYDDDAYRNLDQMFDEDAVDVYPSLEGKGGKRQKTSNGRSNNNALDDFSYLDDLDTTGGGGGGVGGGQQQQQEPSAAFWRNAIGPFIYTFESVDRWRTRQLWLPVLRQLNLLRAKLGTAFTVRRLTWDDELARSLGQKEFTKTAPLYVPMARPMGGLGQNLRLGMQMLFQAMVHRRYIRCEPTRNGNCRGKRDRQFRLPIELVDSKAQRIGCVARLFKQRAKRNLLFGALCTTDRSVSQARHKLVLFSLDQLRNNALKRKLLRDARDFEDEYEDDDDNDDNDDDDENDDDDDNGLQGKKGRVNEYDDDYDADDDRQAGTKVKAVEGDLLQAKADAIVNPTQPSLATGPLGGDEAGAQVLAAKSLFDVVDLQEDGESADGGGGGGAMEKRRVRKKLKALADMLDPERNGAIKDKAKAAQALQKVQQWQAQVADPTKWALLEQEALKRIANGQQQQKNGGGGSGKETLADRIVREGGKVLAQKLKQLAQARAGLPVGDAVATESFQIGVNFFAKKIIHTVPPSVLQTQRDKEKLAECYKRTLQVAVDEGVHKIAFPEMLPAGTDENSRREAIKIGLDTIKKWLIKHNQGKAQQLKTISFWLEKGQQQMLAFLREEIKKTFADGIQQQLTGGSKNRI